MDLGLGYDAYSPINLINKVNVPVFIISSEDDEWVGKEAGKKLFDLANSPKEFWHANTSHDVFMDNPEEVKKRVLEFLGKYIQ